MKKLSLFLPLLALPASANLLLLSGGGEVSEAGPTVNLVVNSESFAVSPWGNIAGGPTMGTGATAPDAGGSDRMTRIDGPDDGRNQSIELEVATAYTISCYMKNVDSAESDLFVFRTGGASLAELEIVWTGATPSEGGGNTANSENVTFTDVVDGWWRVSYTFTSHASETTALFVVKPSASSGANGQAVDYWGAQLEIGSTLTSYVPT